MAIDGTWNCTIKTPLGPQTSTLEVVSSSGKLTGKQSGPAHGEQEIENGTVDGDTASWSIDITSPAPLTLTFDGTVSGNSLSGTVTLGSFGELTFKGERG